MKDIDDIIMIWYLNRYWKYGKEKHDIHWWTCWWLWWWWFMWWRWCRLHRLHLAIYKWDCRDVLHRRTIATRWWSCATSWPSPEEKLSGNLYFHPIQFQLTTDYKTKLIWLMLYVENASPLKRTSTSSPVLPQIGSVAPSKDTKQTHAQQHTRTLPIKIQWAKLKSTATYGKIASTNVVTVLTVQCFDTIFLPTASHTNCNLPQKQSKFWNSMSFLHICVFHIGFQKLSETRLFHKDGSLPLVSSKGKPPRKSNCPRCLSEPFSGQIATLEEGMDMRK